MSPFERLSRFIAQSVRNTTDAGACVRIELRQLADGESDRPVNSWPIKDALDASSDENVDTLATEILTFAQEDADAFGTPTRYFLCAWFGVLKAATSRSPAFMLRSSTSEGIERVGPTEGADSKGLVAQMMRHTEVMFRQSTQHTAQALEAQTTIIARLSASLEKREDREVQVMELADHLITHKGENELKMLQEKQKIKRQDQVGTALKQIAPILLNKVAGKDIWPVEDIPLMTSLEGVFEAIPDEAMMEILNNPKIPETSRIALIELAQAMARRKASKMEKSEAAE